MTTTKPKKRKSWAAYPKDTILYGFHKFGIGVYRFSKKTGKQLEWWIDYEGATDNEIRRYNEYLRSKGWLSEIVFDEADLD